MSADRPLVDGHGALRDAALRTQLAPLTQDGIEKTRVLLVASVRWPLAARLAMAFHELGCRVHAWCPAGHPLEKTRAVERCYRNSILAPLSSLLKAFSVSMPDFIIPCDDDAAVYLQRLHETVPAEALPPGLRQTIQRSLGRPISCSLATRRGELMRIASAEGLRVPETWCIESANDLERWSAIQGYPAVLKVDHSWGGFGVTVVRDVKQARRALLAATQPSLAWALSQLVLRRDPSLVLRQIRGGIPTVTLQRFIHGTPANRAVACWHGEVLAGISVYALETQGENGPMTVAQLTEHGEMSHATERLVRVLGLSGLCGMDFVIEIHTGHAYLIEVNPRATPISHLALGTGRDLPAALHARIRGNPPPTAASSIAGDVIAMFPGEWRRDSDSPYMRSAYHDVPWLETDFLHDCMDLPWEERGLAARARAMVGHRNFPAAASPAVLGFLKTSATSSKK